MRNATVTFIKQFSLVCVLAMAMALSAAAQQITVATYNIRYENKGDADKGDGWERRAPVVAALIRFHDFDIVGTQEGRIGQLRDLDQLLPGYGRIGVGRDDGKEGGEHVAVFYKKDRFKLIRQGNFWLAEETDKPVKGWDAALPRICTWGEFEDVQSGKRLLFYNIHFDHVGVMARSESAKLIMRKMKELGGEKPVILTGDFNVDQHNESYHLLNGSGVLRDIYDLAEIQYALTGTFNHFSADAHTDKRIDHIFVSPHFTVARYGILTDTYRDDEKARVPSDHFPVVVKMRY